MNIFNIKDKTAVVFGGNGFLGQQFCKTLLEFGAFVYSCDVNIEKSKQITDLQKKYPDCFYLMEIDACNKKDLQVLKDNILKNEKSVDILVNSTTSKGEDFYSPFEEVSLDGWNIGLTGNLTIPFLTIQNFIPVMKKQRSGSIINIASHYGIVGNDQRIYVGADLQKFYVKGNQESNDQIFSHGVYNAAKGGLINFTRYLAAYYGEYNIRVNCISPGGIFKEGCENETFTQKYSEKVPLGRRAQVDEMNGALIFLASDASSYVTGHNLVVDGGYTIW